MIYYNICSFIIIGLEHILLEVCERRIEDHILQAALIFSYLSLGSNRNLCIYVLMAKEERLSHLRQPLLFFFLQPSTYFFVFTVSYLLQEETIFLFFPLTFTFL